MLQKVLHNYFDLIKYIIINFDLTKLFSDLYLTKFLYFSKTILSLFPCILLVHRYIVKFLKLIRGIEIN